MMTPKLLFTRCLSTTRGLCKNAEKFVICGRNDKIPSIYEIRLNRPDRYNALSGEMLAELKAAVKSASYVDNFLGGNNKSIKLVVVRSEVPGMFCAGADLKERLQMKNEQVLLTVSTIKQLFTSISNLAYPTVALVDGKAFGGGFELALACDMIICSKNARFALPETSIGIIPGAVRLMNMVGYSKAVELVCSGKVLTAEDAKQLNIVNEMHEEFDADMSKNYSEKMETVKLMLKNSATAMSLAKRSMLNSVRKSMLEALELEAYYYSHTVETDDRMEGLLAFKEKRKPKYD